MSLDNNDKLKVVVLDDDRLSSHNLGIQLKFVGETPVLTTSENWRTIFSIMDERGESSSILGIVIGVIRKNDLLTVLREVHQHSDSLPILLHHNFDEQQSAELTPELRENLIVLGEASLNYEILSSALKTARQLTGREARELHSSIISPTGSALFRSLSGNSAAMQRIRQLLHQVAKRDVTVLVIGESGTGKEVVARNLHYHSGRGERPFIAVNCAAIAPDRYGVELFGQARGVDGARENIAGPLEKAHGGTLFFDEIAELPLNIQALLLRFLEDKSFQRTGGGEVLSTDVRIVVGNRQSLEEKVRAGKFRKDLYYRLSIVPIELPPLRKRLADIPDLIGELISSLENKGYGSIRFNTSALQSLQKHDWPGNVRELANLVERLCIIHPNDVVGISDLPLEYQYAEAAGEVLTEAELDAADPATQRLERVLTATSNNSSNQLAEPNSQHIDKLQPEANQTVFHNSVGDAANEQQAFEPQHDGFANNQNSQHNVNSNEQDVSSQNHELQGNEVADANQWDNGANGHNQPEITAPRELSPSEMAAAENQKAQANLHLALNSAPPPRPEPMSISIPLNGDLLQQYLRNFELHLLQVALDDSANIKSFAAERLKLSVEELSEKMQEYSLASAS